MQSISHVGLDYLDYARTYNSAILGVVVWDWLTSLGSEYSVIWRKPWSLTKALYIAARYVCLCLVGVLYSVYYARHTVSQCQTLLRLNCVALIVIQMTSMTILTQRAYFVSRKRKLVLGVLAFPIIATLATGIAHAAVTIQVATAPMYSGVCVNEASNEMLPLSLVFFGLPILGHTLAICLIVYHASRDLKSTSRLRRILIIDGVVYLLSVNGIGFANFICALLAVKASRLRSLNETALLSLTAVLCCRLILHVKVQGQQVIVNPIGTVPEVRLTLPGARNSQLLSRSGDKGKVVVTDASDLQHINLTLIPSPAITYKAFTNLQVEEPSEDERDWLEKHPSDPFSHLR